MLLHGHGPEFAGADGTPDPDRSRFSHYQGCLSSQGVGGVAKKAQQDSEISKCPWNIEMQLAQLLWNAFILIHLNSIGDLGPVWLS